MMDAASIPAVNQTTTSADTRDRGTHGSGEDITIQDLIRNWGESDPSSDLNEDGIVDLDDLLLLLEKRSSSNGVINSLMEAPNAAIEGLASLGGLLMEALGIRNPDQSTPMEFPKTEAAEALDLSGMKSADVDIAMKTAKGMIDRWQSRGYASSPPPGFEQIIDTLPLDREIRSVISKLVEAGYSS